MFRKAVFLFAIVVLFSCENKSAVEQEIEKIPITMEVLRFDRKFAEANRKTLPALKADFPYLFPENVTDSVWLAKINDTLQQALNREVYKVYPNFEVQKDALYQLFQHLKYYFPSFSEPKVVTLTSDVDFRNRVIATDSLLLISLDVYLGRNHEFYKGIYPYLRAHFEPELIVSDVAEVYAKKYVPRPQARSFLAKMVYHGKILHVKDLLLPSKSDSLKIEYSKAQLDWAKSNEEEIWRYFVEKEILYSTDENLKARFIDIGPYSKFYLKLDSESPPRLGRYLGWQIVRQFVDKNPEVALKELLAMDAKNIFEKSNYKPGKE